MQKLCLDAHNFNQLNCEKGKFYSEDVLASLENPAFLSQDELDRALGVGRERSLTTAERVILLPGHPWSP